MLLLTLVEKAINQNLLLKKHSAHLLLITIFHLEEFSKNGSPLTMVAKARAESAPPWEISYLKGRGD